MCWRVRVIPVKHKLLVLVMRILLMESCNIAAQLYHEQLESLSLGRKKLIERPIDAASEVPSSGHACMAVSSPSILPRLIVLPITRPHALPIASIAP